MDTHQTAIPLVAVTPATDPTPPVPLDMDALQRVIRDVLNDHETERQQALDARDERLKTATRNEIKDELRPLQEALTQRVTADEARKIAEAQVSPIQEQMKALEQSVASGFDGFREMLTGMSDGIQAIKGLPEKIAHLEGKVGAYTDLQVKQDELRTAAVLRAETKADDAMKAAEAGQREMATRFTTLHTDLYGVPGGPMGALALTQRNAEAIAEFRPAVDRLNTFLDRREAREDEDRAKLDRHDRWIEGQMARQQKRDAALATIRANTLKLFSNRLLVGVVMTAVVGALIAMGIAPDTLASLVDLFR